MLRHLVWAQREADFVGAETERHGADHVWQDRNVIKLLDHAFDLESMFQIAGFQVHHTQLAFRRHAFARQPFVQCKVVKGAVFARARQAEHGVIPDETDATGKAGQKANRLEMASGQISMAELSSAGLQQPQLAVVQAHQHPARRYSCHLRRR